MEKSISDIPEDLFIHILLCLPVISLLRIKSVCKSWRSLIESSRFITRHYQKMDSEKFIVNHNGDFSLLSTADNFDTYENVDSPYVFKDKSVLETAEFRYGKWISSCNGVICLQSCTREDVYLWNPATKQFRVLPETHIPRPPCGANVSIFLGFVFDVKTDDYKAVRIIFERLMYATKRRVEMYNLSTDSWRPIDVDLTVDYIASDPKVPYQDRLYCWLGRVGKEPVDYRPVCDHLILSFDIHKEVFGTMSLPDDCDASRPASLELAILEGKFACISCSGVSSVIENWHFKIWVLNQCGLKESWTQLYTIRLGSQLGSWARPMGFSKNRIFVILYDKECMCDIKECYCDKERKMCFCYPPTKEVKILPLQAPQVGWQAVQYKESLVSIKSIKGAIN